MKNILIVDDDIHIGNMLEELLTDEGYGVKRAYSGTEAVYALAESNTDLVLLDLMLPGLCGEEVLPKIKDIPVIILSAKVDTDSKVELLLSGAVDYVTKPFNMKELSACIAVHLRTFGANIKKDVISFQDIELHSDTHIVKSENGEIKLTRTEYAILRLLMQNYPQIISKSALLDRISVDTPDCTESSLKTHISHLRAKLSEISGKDCIETVWGIGFKMKENQEVTK